MKYIIFIVLCAVKFGFTIPVGIVVYDLSFFQSVALSFIGGSIGVIFFAFLTELLNRFWQKYIGQVKWVEAIKSWWKSLFNRKKAKRMFTRRNKLIIKAKRNYGLIGLAFLTPVMLSIPIGTFITCRYYPDYKKTIPAILISVLGWGIIISFVFSYLT